MGGSIFRFDWHALDCWDHRVRYLTLFSTPPCARNQASSPSRGDCALPPLVAAGDGCGSSFILIMRVRIVSSPPSVAGSIQPATPAGRSTTARRGSLCLLVGDNVREKDASVRGDCLRWVVCEALIRSKGACVNGQRLSNARRAASSSFAN